MLLYVMTLCYVPQFVRPNINSDVRQVGCRCMYVNCLTADNVNTYWKVQVIGAADGLAGTTRSPDGKHVLVISVVYLYVGLALRVTGVSEISKR